MEGTTVITRTYLEMTSPEELRAAPLPDVEPSLERLLRCPPEIFRQLYAEVGRAFSWTERLTWTDEEVRRHLDDPRVSIWLLSWEGRRAGYFELRQHDDNSVEIAYFGLLPEFIGKGWGKYLLTRAARAAWSLEPERIWLHTCTLDHPAALPNYLKRGFRRTREEVYELSQETG
jgi:ribosomal protein S18 acetylase RimI-like enzyme